MSESLHETIVTNSEPLRAALREIEFKAALAHDMMDDPTSGPARALHMLREIARTALRTP